RKPSHQSYPNLKHKTLCTFFKCITQRCPEPRIVAFHLLHFIASAQIDQDFACGDLVSGYGADHEASAGSIDVNCFACGEQTADRLAGIELEKDTFIAGIVEKVRHAAKYRHGTPSFVPFNPDTGRHSPSPHADTMGSRCTAGHQTMLATDDNACCKPIVVRYAWLVVLCLRYGSTCREKAEQDDTAAWIHWTTEM